MATDDLFDLIKALTPSEKRYFKIHAKTHVGNKYKNSYEKLFDALNYWPDDMPYDEKVFKRKHKGKTFTKNLSVEKNYLYELTLETLRKYQADNKHEIKLHQLTADLRLLYDKGLHSQGKKLINKAYAEAEASEQLPFMITLCQYRDRFSRYRQTDEEMQLANQNFETEKQLLKTLEAERSIVHLRRQIFNLYITGKLKTEIDLFKQQLAGWEEKNKNTAITTAAQRYRIACYALIADKEGDYKSAMKWYEELLPLAEKQLQNSREPIEYMRTLLSNYLVCAHHCERYDLFDSIIKRIEEQPAPTPRDKAEIFIHTYQYRLLYHLNVPGTKGGEDVVQAIEKGIKKHHALIAPKIEINLRMNICIYLLKSKNYKNITNAINNAYEILGRNEKYITLLRDLRFIEIMINLSLKNFDRLDYLVRNINRWLHDHKMHNSYTETLLVYFKKCIKNGKALPAATILNGTASTIETAMLAELIKIWAL